MPTRPSPGAPRVSGRYLSLGIRGTPEETARAVLNLVNVQGPGPVAVGPPGAVEQVAEALAGLDPTGGWRSWWEQAAGEPVTLTDRPVPAVPAPAHPVRSWKTTGLPLLGVNVGGHYLRLVRVEAGAMTGSRQVRLGTGSASSLHGMPLRAFGAFIGADPLAQGVRGVGIAWSAPRTMAGLRAMSLPTAGAGEVADLLHAGALDASLTRTFGCPVRSWNDGEAVAAAEAVAGAMIPRPLLTLKLGTSFASGLALAPDRVTALPMQLSKCVPAARPPHAFPHPMTGSRGTARDALGATSTTQAFRLLTGRTQARFSDYCVAVGRGDPAGLTLAAVAAQVIAELAFLVSELWSPVDLILTGKNLQARGHRDTLMNLVRRELGGLPAKVRLRTPRCDVQLSAALGALALSLGAEPADPQEERR